MTTIIDKREALPVTRSNPAADMAAHIVLVTAMMLSIAKIVAVNSDDAELDGFLGNFAQQCEKMGTQYSPAVLALVQKTSAEIVTQLRDAHRGH